MAKFKTGDEVVYDGHKFVVRAVYAGGNNTWEYDIYSTDYGGFLEKAKEHELVARRDYVGRVHNRIRNIRDHASFRADVARQNVEEVSDRTIAQAALGFTAFGGVGTWVFGMWSAYN